MRFIVTLLSLTVTLTALVALNGAVIGGVSEPASRTVSGGRGCSWPMRWR